MTICFSMLASAIATQFNTLTILAAIAIAGGLCFFYYGFHLLLYKRELLNTPNSQIHQAVLGLLEAHGKASGPYTLSAPISGQPCFLYQTTAWRQRNGKKQWEQVADETLHVPFFIDDSTGQLLIEPFGADLDLHRNFHEEYDHPFLSSGSENLPACVSNFLSRHGIASASRLRIEERIIKAGDALFISGTLAENPGIKIHQPAQRNDPSRYEPTQNDPSRNDPSVNARPETTNANPDLAAPENSVEPLPAPQVIRLAAGAAASSSQHMGQQAKIVAALTRAGITRPEAWTAAGIEPQTLSAQEKAPTATPRIRSGASLLEMPLRRAAPRASEPVAPNFNLTPPVVLMQGAKNPTFVISFRSQKEFVSALAWKSTAMLFAGALTMLIGLYTLLHQAR